MKKFIVLILGMVFSLSLAIGCVGINDLNSKAEKKQNVLIALGFSNLQGQINNLQVQINNLQIIITQIQTDITNIQTTDENLKSQISQINVYLGYLNGRLKKLDKDEDRDEVYAKREFAYLNAQVNILFCLLNGKNGVFAQIDALSKKLNKDYTQIEGQIFILGISIIGINLEVEQNEKDFNNKIKAIWTAIGQLNAAISQIQITDISLQNQIYDLQNQINLIVANVSILQVTVAQNSTDITALLSRVTLLEQFETYILNVFIPEINAEIASLQALTQLTADQVAQLSLLITDIQNNITSINNSIIAIENDLAFGEAAFQSLVTEITTIEGDIAILEAQIAAIPLDDDSSLQNQINTLLAMVNSINQTLATIPGPTPIVDLTVYSNTIIGFVGYSIDGGDLTVFTIKGTGSHKYSTAEKTQFANINTAINDIKTIVNTQSPLSTAQKNTIKADLTAIQTAIADASLSKSSLESALGVTNGDIVYNDCQVVLNMVTNYMVVYANQL